MKNANILSLLNVLKVVALVAVYYCFIGYVLFNYMPSKSVAFIFFY